MATIRVFTADEFLAAMKANPNSVMSVIKKKEDKVYKAGSKFMNVKWDIADKKKAEGWFSVEDIPINAVQDPSRKKVGAEETKPQISTSVSRAGSFGEAFSILQPIWYAMIEALIEDGSIKKDDKRTIHDLMQMKISERNEGVDDEGNALAGQLLEDPVIRFKVEFTNFPPTYPVKFLAGQPKTQLYDYRTKYTDTKGKEQFKLAVVCDVDGNETPVGESNLHDFITPGSVLRKGRIMITSVSISQYWISVQIAMNKAVIEPGGEMGFSDDGPVSAVTTAVENAITDGAEAAVAPTVNTAVPDATEGATADDVSALLGEL